MQWNKSMNFTITETEISGVLIVESQWRGDIRGGFSRLFCMRELEHWLQGRKIVQVNQSLTTKVGSIRGLHYQNPPFCEMKIINCMEGSVFDVAVDLRRGSSTYLKYVGAELSSENHRMLVVPEGCAHGFQVLKPNSRLLYFHTEYYAPESEGGIRYDDNLLKIDWPLAVTNVSEKDLNHSLLDTEYKGIRL
jgi:dTDP-4-dehydrorhamnose 3,5-epimerase